MLQQVESSKISSVEKVSTDKIIEAKLILTIPNAQWFIIKNNSRKLIVQGKIQLVLNPSELSNKIASEPKEEMLVFLFENNKALSYVVGKQYSVFKLSNGHYIFGSNDEYFGLIIDNNINDFENILKNYVEETRYQVSNIEKSIYSFPHNDNLEICSPDKIAYVGIKLSQYIREGTVVLATNLRKSTIYATEGIHKSASKLKLHIQPNQIPTNVSSNTQSRLAKIKIGATAAAKISGAMVTGAIAAANVLTNEITNAISETELGKKIAAEQGPKTKAAKDVIKSTISGVVTIYDEFINSGLTIVRESTHATAGIVEHKYGKQAGLAALSTAEVISSMSTTVTNINKLGVKPLVKRVAKNTTMDILADKNEQIQRQ